MLATTRTLLASSAIFAGGLNFLAIPAHAQSGGPVEQVVVQADQIKTSAVSGLDLSLRETPQSVTVVDHQTIEDFHLTNANDLLDMVTGVNVERVETDRTYYNSRGFDVTNFQTDGIGLPLISGIQFGDLDTAIFDRVEVIRGANGMMTGTGNPSATINYVRKRPTSEFQSSVGVSYGSWDDKRLDADISGPLVQDGSVRGRLVYANEDRDSYLDYYHVNRNVFYGALAWDITSRLTATGGYSWQDNRARGVLWGALPLNYSDGTQIDYPVSASTSADWTYWSVRDQTGFGELAYQLGGGWQLKGVATYRRFDEHAKLLYAFGNPDPVTGLGVAAMSGIYPSSYSQYLLDAVASGPFTLFGREHELVLGAQTTYAEGAEIENFYDGNPDYPPISRWGIEQIAEPTYPGAYLAAATIDRMQRFYGATHLNITDALKAVIGLNGVAVKTTGFSYGVDQARNETAVSPYAGLVYDLTSAVSLYASYTDIFNPQVEVDSNHRELPAGRGKSYEAGVKSEWFDKRLYATASIFKSEQYGLAEFAGTFDDGKSYYAGLDTFVEGYELEVSGRITDLWTVSGGWTGLSMKDSGGADVRTYQPRKTLKLSTTYTIPALQNLKVGAAVRWQSQVHIEDVGLILQPSYAVFDLLAGIDVVQNLRANINLRNVADEKYLTSLKWNQAFYAAPRSVTVSLDYRL
ncbi:MAG TPA: TonB-dependent siderophore receptor [Rhizomicrobium sp.]